MLCWPRASLRLYALRRDGMQEFVVEDMPVFMHVHTYNNHPVSTATGMKNLEIIEREDLVENSAEVGAYLRKGLLLAVRPPQWLGTCGAWG